MTKKLELTEQDKRVIKKLYKGGWKKFASNIENQGWISEKQRETLITIYRKLQRIQSLDSKFKRNKVAKSFYDDFASENNITDCEIMSFNI